MTSTPSQPVRQKQPLPLWLMMLTGGISGSWAEFCTIPLDTAKVRLQLQGQNNQSGGTQGLKYKGLFNTMQVMIQEEGFTSLYKGLVAGFQRQMVFASFRIGMYEPVRNFYAGKDFKGDPPLLKKIAAGLTTGALGMLIANPTDLIKIRLQGEGKKPANERRYKSVTEAWVKIYKQEGLAAYWTGVGPNIVRNSVINAAELATYDQAKQTILNYKLMNDNIYCHFVSSAIAGFVAAVVGSPVDVIKTRIMNANKLTGETYNGIADCIVKTWKENGILAFYKGFNANAQRIITWNIVMFVTLQQVRNYVGQRYYGW